jgi:hypothetical protein
VQTHVTGNSSTQTQMVVATKFPSVAVARSAASALSWAHPSFPHLVSLDGTSAPDLALSFFFSAVPSVGAPNDWSTL